MNKKEATNRAKFFSEYLFGLKAVPPIELLSDKKMEEFMEECAKSSQVFQKRSCPINGCFVCEDVGTSVKDDCNIYINTTICSTIEQFNSTLIHELTHYALWWQGRDYRDGEKDFESKLKELGLTSNFDSEWIDGKRVRKVGDLDKLNSYEEAYQEHLNKSSQPIEKECPICGTRFMTANKNRLYCDECRIHPEQKRRQLEESIDTIRKIVYTPNLATYNCEYCGKEHTIPKNLLYKVKISDRTSWDGNDHFFCCIEHLEAYKHEHSTCSNCGKSLQGCTYQFSSSRPNNYCCAECETEHQFKLAEAENKVCTCQQCGNRFISKRSVAYFCSKECSTAAIKAGWRSPLTIERKKAAEEAKVEVELTCAECGTRFTKVYRNKNAAIQEQKMQIPHFCSKTCDKSWWYKERERAKERKQKAAEAKKNLPIKSLCSNCKTCYKDCERMQSNFRISPKGARYNSEGILIECPKYTRG